MLKSFTPGQQSVFVRNPNYWEDGADGKPLPYLDEVVITDYSDETSQVNALISGAVDCIDLLSYESIAPLKAGGQEYLVSDGGSWVPFTMRVDVAPFNEVDVRQAFRLIVNRPQMLEHVFGGYGLVGNDIFAIEDPEYDHAIPQRVQDIEQAKFLLNKHGIAPDDDDAYHRTDRPGRRRGGHRLRRAGGGGERYGQPPADHGDRVLRTELFEMGLRPGLVGMRTTTFHR